MLYHFKKEEFLESINLLAQQFSYRQYALIDNNTYSYMYFSRHSYSYLDYIFLYYLKCLRPAFKYQLEYGINFSYPTKVKLTLKGRWFLWNLCLPYQSDIFIKKVIQPHIKPFKKYLNKLVKNGMALS